jgi:hypothetical protein
MKKPHFFNISKNQWHSHHCDKEKYPEWTMELPASLHMVLSALQRMETSDNSLAVVRAFTDACEWIYLDMRRELDERQRTD